MPSLVPRQNTKVVFRDLAEGGVLLHLESGQYHSLNETGAAIWKLIDGRRTSNEIANALGAQLDEPPPDIDLVVVGFLTGLRERDLTA
jgi:hypothetical protein